VAEQQLREGHRDVMGLCMALADWSAELRLLEEEQRRLLNLAHGARPGSPGQ
jgi:hypothetical protein